MQRSYDFISKNPDRDLAVAEFIKDEQIVKGSGLIFVRHKHHARKQASALSCVLGIDIPCVTSEMDRASRQDIATRLNDGSLPVAVCTSVWATGIDIPNLRWVVLAGAGRAPIALLQSVGRAARVGDDGKKSDGYEIINLMDGGAEGQYERQAIERLTTLEASGFTVETSAKRQVAIREQVQQGNPDDMATAMRNLQGFGRSVFGPLWLWVILLSIGAFLDYLCKCGVIGRPY